MEPLTDKKTRVWLALMKFGARFGCHQMRDRSFSYKGYQFPVCARCTGVILGEIVSIIMILCSLRIDALYAALFIVPLALDGGLQYINILESNNIRRLITGVLAGFGLTYIYFYIFRYLIHILFDCFIRI